MIKWDNLLEVEDKEEEKETKIDDQKKPEEEVKVTEEAQAPQLKCIE